MPDETVWRTMLFDFYGDLLTDKQREYYDLHYNQDLSLAEIAASSGISRQGVWDNIRRADRDNAIDVYIGEDYMDVLADGRWESIFKEKPEVFTKEEKRAWLDQMTDVALGSDAFFPFGDNVERARKSGVSYIVEPGGSIRDDNVIETANRYHMVMAFTGMRLFHH